VVGGRRAGSGKQCGYQQLGVGSEVVLVENLRVVQSVCEGMARVAASNTAGSPPILSGNGDIANQRHDTRIGTGNGSYCAGATPESEGCQLGRMSRTVARAAAEQSCARYSAVH
jgi:hypothetical protein